MADTTTAQRWPSAFSRATLSAACSMRSIFATDVPPNFMTSVPMCARYPFMTSTANKREIENFTNLAMHWWDEQGPMQPLHRINLVRMPLLKRWIEAHGRAVKGAKILDVGCGGGLVCEPLARLGAT